MSSSIASSSDEKTGTSLPVRGLSADEFLDPDFDPKYLKMIVKEGIVISAGAVAILLQMASPGVAAGVNEHSNFAYRVQDRLRTTMTFGEILFWVPRETISTYSSRYLGTSWLTFRS